MLSLKSQSLDRLLVFFLVLLVPTLLPACKTTSSRLNTEESFSTKLDPNSFIKQMYAKYNPGYEIQNDSDTPDDCASFFVPADEGVPYKGVAVFHHGYTACPQQYWEFAQSLKKKGYASLSILMPGQGRGPAPFAYAERLTGEKSILSPIEEKDLRLVNGRRYSEYYAEFIPKVQNGDWKRYLEFVEDINVFVKTLPGEKILGGLSVGGELATYAYIAAPGLYKRVLLMAPYYGMPGPDLVEKYSGTDMNSEALYKMQKKIVTLGSRELSEVAHMEVSWGPDCYQWTRGKNGIPGRRGICDFRFENLAAVNSVGDYVLTLLKDYPSLAQIPKVQYVAVDWDVGSNTVLARKAIAYQQKRFESQVSACFYPHSVPHSFFSRKDLVLIPETPWLDGFYRQAVDFLVDGKTFPAGSTESREYAMDAVTGKDLKVKQASCVM